MTEKIITVKRGNIIGLIFVHEVDLNYIDRKVVVYCKKEHTGLYKRLERLLDTGRVNTRHIREKLAYVLKTDIKLDDVEISEPIEFVSGNKNKSERNKRLLESLGLKKAFERTVIYLGEKSVRHLRKRPKKTEHKSDLHEK